MKRLNKYVLDEKLKIGSDRPEKIIQFGEGNFLRAFIDEMVDTINEKELFNGSIVVIQPIKNGLIDILNEQDGLYTLFLRGMENGKEICKKRVITSISRGINPYKDYDAYMKCAENEDLSFVISNTTEAGIVFLDSDNLEDKPQISFPGKVTAFLYKRYRHFNGDKTKGLVFIPCELIDNNGTELKTQILKFASKWNLESEFITWVNEDNIFTNTLVDRIVTGYPRDEAKALTEELGYEDKLLDTGEIFHFWVIDGPDFLSEELPFVKAFLNVVWTDDATHYKMRKVRILNGAHTASVLAAFLAGKETVGEMIADEIFHRYLKIALFEEIIPTLDLDYEDLRSFANAVFDRFANPYIKHFLLNIALNSVSKYKTRVLPSILEYYKRKNSHPKVLTFSMAALIAFYRGDEAKDDAFVIETFRKEYEECDLSKVSIEKLVGKILRNEIFWGMDLTTLPDFCEKVSEHLFNIFDKGVMSEVKNLIC